MSSAEIIKKTNWIGEAILRLAAQGIPTTFDNISDELAAAGHPMSDEELTCLINLSYTNGRFLVSNCNPVLPGPGNDSQICVNVSQGQTSSCAGWNANFKNNMLKYNCTLGHMTTVQQPPT